MWWEWPTAILVASLLGSGHCVGMCGPFAVLATHGSSTSTHWTQRVSSLASYHLGRLATYLLLGALMGGIGSVADGLAIGAGWSPVAARGVGGMMVVMGLMLVLRWWRGNRALVSHSGWAARWNQLLLGIRKRWRVRSAAGGAFSWGLISTWLPCGWLYVFAIAAAGAGGVAWGMALMTAFWIGTLPLLSLVPLGAWMISSSSSHHQLATSAQRFVQLMAACFLIAFGIFTATGRAGISLSDLETSTSDRSRDSVQAQLREVIDQDLPCCVDGEEDAGERSDESRDGK